MNNGDAGGPSGLGFPFEGEVRSVAVPIWTRPCFAIPLITFGPGSNSAYVQNVDMEDRIISVSPFDVPGEAVVALNKAASGVHLDAPSLHAVVEPDGNAVAGTRAALAPVISAWLDQVSWPTTRLAFADFLGDERAIISAADAALKDKAGRHGRAEASVWFANAVVFPRIQRSALHTATTSARRALIEAALDQMRMEVSETDIVARLPPLLTELFDGAKIRATPDFEMASRLSRLLTPQGLSLTSEVLAPSPRTGLSKGGDRSAAARMLNKRRTASATGDDLAPRTWTAQTLRQAAADKVSRIAGVEVKRHRGSLYEATDGSVRAVISTSRRYDRVYQAYWYCFYDTQRAFLGDNPANHLVLGALDTGRIWAVPAQEIESFIGLMNMTKRDNGQTYRHILSKLVGERCVIVAGRKEFDISPFEI
jgi:hypothetical protein